MPPITHRGLTRPELRRVDHPRVCRGGEPVLQLHAPGQLFQSRAVRNALDLYPVGLGPLVARVGDALLQAAVVGQHHQALAVAIQATGRVDIRRGYVIGQGGAVLRIGELTQYSVGFVEQKDSAHATENARGRRNPSGYRNRSLPAQGRSRARSICRTAE